jgi:hypothetical protein
MADWIKEWINQNVDSTDLLAVCILIAVVILAVNGVGGEDLPKVVIGGLVGYLSKRTVTK